MHYRWMNQGDRIEAPLVKHAQAPSGYRAVDWDEAIARAGEILRGVSGRAVALVSPRASTEALFLARRLLRAFEWTGAFQVVMGDEAPLVGVPNLALRAERAPNVRGAELLGYGRDFAAALQAAESAALVLVLDDPTAVFRTAGKTIYLGTHMPDAASQTPDLVLPIANTAEEEGTFVNRDDRVQRYLQARSGPGMARPAWWLLAELETERADIPATTADVFAQMAEAVEAFTGLSYSSLGLRGRRTAESGVRA
jgi:NADH-quinone oxidoreductase subunit G